MAGLPSILYKRGTFVTQLPVHHRYSPSHCCLAEVEPGQWLVGFTKFALRMLGELVHLQFEASADAPIEPGDVLGSIEGFKAVSDLFAVGRGRFLGGNPALKDDLDAVAREPYGAGWTYAFEGTPDDRTLDVDGYQNLLNATIDRILSRQKPDASE